MTKMERIEKLLHELRYEVETGMLQGEIDEHIEFDFIVQVSKSFRNSVVVCTFRTRPMDRNIVWETCHAEPRLKVVK